MPRFALVPIGTIFVLVAMLGPGSRQAPAAENTSGPTLDFAAAVSYVQDLNDPSGGSPGLNALGYSSMEQDESFNIDLIQLTVSGSRGRASYRATLDFGDLAAFAGDSLVGDIALQEANLTYEFDPVLVTVGRFATPIGQEVLEPWGNAHIGRSWSWQGQPINHDGLTLSRTLGSLELMGGVVNSFTVSDPSGNDVDNEKGLLGSFWMSVSEALDVHGTGIFSRQGDVLDQQMYNLIVSGNLAAPRPLRYAVEANYRNNDPDGAASMEFWSLVLYGGTNFGALGADVRFEYMDDDGIVLGADSALWGTTLTFSWPLTDGVVVRAEYRHDDASDSVFTDGSSMGDTLDTLQAQILWFPRG